MNQFEDYEEALRPESLRTSWSRLCKFDESGLPQLGEDLRVLIQSSN